MRGSKNSKEAVSVIIILSALVCLVIVICLCSFGYCVADSRIQILFLPNTRRKLTNNPWIQDKVVDETLVTYKIKKRQIVHLCVPRTPRYELCVCELTFIGLWGDIQHEREEVLQELCVVIRKLQVLAVFSADTKEWMKLILSFKTESKKV